jgi:hypothetical protein
MTEPKVSYWWPQILVNAHIMNSYKSVCSKRQLNAKFLWLESSLLLLTVAGHKHIPHSSSECKRMHEESGKKCREFLTGKYYNPVPQILVELCALGGGSCTCPVWCMRRWCWSVFTLHTVSRSTFQSWTKATTAVCFHVAPMLQLSNCML